MPVYVEVAVNVPQVSDVFHYHLPAHLEGKVRPGQLVEAPFGKQLVQGVVLRQIDQPDVPETRPIQALVDENVLLTPAQMQLAYRLADYYLAPLSACIGLMLPPGLQQLADTQYTLLKNETTGDDLLGELQKRVLQLLEKRGTLRGRQIEAHFGPVKWENAARALVRDGYLSAAPVLPPPHIQPKTLRSAQIACSPEKLEALLPQIGKTGPTVERRNKVLALLMREAEPVEAAWIYAETGANAADLKYLAERGFITLGESEIWRDPLEHIQALPSKPPELTGDQKKVWAEIQTSLRRATSQAVKPILLQGVTGSGKTEIYLQAVAEVIRAGKQAIILVPEIALTPQTVRRFMGRFPGQVGLMHSGLSVGERYDTWRRARSGLINVLVGPRSALFAPFENLGLIILDESHDESYYQDESPPFYHARQAAEIYAQLTGAVYLQGSATPDIQTRFLAEAGKLQYLTLPRRILAHRQTLEAQIARWGLAGQVKTHAEGELEAETMTLPDVRLIDMREELKSGNRSIFSRALLTGLQEVLANHQQAILFLNRRGTATYVFCRDCGASLKCPRCDIPLTFHQDGGQLTCHRCGYARQMPSTCPTCGSRKIRQYGAGTERVESELKEIFPEARLLRWDAETTKKKGAHEIILSHFSNHRADILIGTQMLAKGLDLPLVTLVGVVLADVGLNMPDYRAAERTFQVLTQVAGRAGRSPLGGQVVLQTFQPEHYAVQAAAGHDYEAFYQRELAYRKELAYPPFTRLARLEYRHRDAQAAEAGAKKLAAQLKSWIAQEDRRATSLIGPAPAYFMRVNNQFRWQIILRGPDPASLLRRRNLGEWRVEIDPPNLL